MSTQETPLVLVIEDDPICAGILTEILTDHQSEVIRARKLSEAETLITARRFNIVFVDGLLPDGSGEDFVKKHRELLVGSHVIFCSSFFRRFGASEKLKKDTGVETVLNKPFTRSEVVEAASPHLPPQRLKDVPMFSTTVSG